jgi:hypothetical protein
MPKPHTLPTLYNEVKQIDLKELRQWGYLKPNVQMSGVITWSRNGVKTSSISIRSNTGLDDPFLEISYTCDGQEIKYKVRLVTVPSNLGKGFVWYLQCPSTFKLCRKLYFISGKFLHREAFRECMYDTQTLSHKDRGLIRLFDRSVKMEKAHEKIYSKHFKTHYAGRPTKRYLKLKRQIEQGAGIDVRRLMLM